VATNPGHNARTSSDKFSPVILIMLISLHPIKLLPLISSSHTVMLFQYKHQTHATQNLYRVTTISFIVGLFLIGVSGCGTRSSPEASPGSPSSAIASSSPTSPTPVSPSPAPDSTQGVESPVAANPTTSPTAPVTVTLYKVDSQCETLVPETAQVPGDRALEETVGKILSAQSNQDFQLGGYRVNIANGVATVDFRLTPSSRRQMVSLSTCEQFALFGSLRKTLIENSQWQIKSVRFTERGEELEF
jgi:hypothetical protein